MIRLRYHFISHKENSNRIIVESNLYSTLIHLKKPIDKILFLTHVIRADTRLNMYKISHNIVTFFWYTNKLRYALDRIYPREPINCKLSADLEVFSLPIS